MKCPKCGSKNVSVRRINRDGKDYIHNEHIECGWEEYIEINKNE